MNIYNIFLRAIPGWNCLAESVIRAKRLGFDAIFINACFLPGKSNSIYSIKDFYRLDPQSFQSGCNPKEELKKFFALCNKEKMPVIMDLVANHTSIDSPLLNTHKSWYYFCENGDVRHPMNIDSQEKEPWTDCAWLNYESEDKTLWEFMLNVARFWLAEGFAGFRCDIANSVYVGFWRYLIRNIKNDYPNTIFIAETFACPVEKILALSEAGFDYIFNSSKWWDFSSPWLLEQYNCTKKHIASISIPDNHDTERAMRELNGDCAKYLQRLYFTGFFSKGFMMTCGFEYGFVNKLNVVNTTGADWEETGLDFTEEVARMIMIRKQYAPLHEECDIYHIYNDDKVVCLLKDFQNEKILILINKRDIEILIPLSLLNKRLVSFGFESIEPQHSGLLLKPSQIQVYENGKGVIIGT